MANESAVREQEFRAVQNSLKAIRKGLPDSKFKKAAGAAAKPVRETAERLTPELKNGTEHYRYENKSGKKKAKGEGVVKATYKKGHLKKAIKILRFRQAKRSVSVGPKFNRKLGAAGGVFGNNRTRVDAYYAHMVFGSALAFRKKVTELALKAKSRAAVSIYEAELTKYLIEIKRKTGL